MHRMLLLLVSILPLICYAGDKDIEYLIAEQTFSPAPTPLSDSDRIHLHNKLYCLCNPIREPESTFLCCQWPRTVEQTGCLGLKSWVKLPRSTYTAIMDELFYPGGPWDTSDETLKKWYVSSMHNGCNTCTLFAHCCLPLSILSALGFFTICTASVCVSPSYNCCCPNPALHDFLVNNVNGPSLITSVGIWGISALLTALHSTCEDRLSNPDNWDAKPDAQEIYTDQSSSSL